MKRAIVVVCSWAASLCLAAAYLAIGWGIDDIAGKSAWSTWWIGVLGALGSGVFAWAVSALGAAQMNQMEPALRHSMIRQVFACGTAAVVTPITRLAGDDFDVEIEVGDRTREIHKRLTDIQWGRAEDPYGWTYRLV